MVAAGAVMRMMLLMIVRGMMMRRWWRSIRLANGGGFLVDLVVTMMALETSDATAAVEMCLQS